MLTKQLCVGTGEELFYLSTVIGEGRLPYQDQERHDFWCSRVWQRLVLFDIVSEVSF